MTLLEKLEANYQAGRYTLVADKVGDYKLFTLLVGTLFYCSDWNLIEEDCYEELTRDVISINLINKYAKEQGWEIVKTIHPSELMGDGYKVGDKVRILSGIGEGDVCRISEVRLFDIECEDENITRYTTDKNIEPYFSDDQEDLKQQISKLEEELKKIKDKIK